MPCGASLAVFMQDCRGVWVKVLKVGPSGDFEAPELPTDMRVQVIGE